MRWFQPFTVSPDLGDALECRYVGTTADRHVLIPDGCMELLWIAGMGVMVCGPDTRAWTFQLPAGTESVGVRFRPGAASGVFRVDAAQLRDQRVAVADLLGGRHDRILRERLDHAGSPVERMTLLEELVRSRRAGRHPDDTVQLADLVASGPAYGVERLAAHTGVSSRQLRRRFDRHVGYGPAFFARIARLQRFAIAAARMRGTGLAELAAIAGYADQPHLAKECRALTALTPRQLVEVLPATSLAPRLGDIGSVTVRARVA